MAVVGRFRVAAAIVGVLAMMASGCTSDAKRPPTLASAVCSGAGAYMARGGDLAGVPRPGVSAQDLHRFIEAYALTHCGPSQGPAFTFLAPGGSNKMAAFEIFLGKRATNDDRRRVAAWLRASGLAVSVRVVPKH